jgi:hypothetical protein
MRWRLLGIVLIALQLQIFLLAAKCTIKKEPVPPEDPPTDPPELEYKYDAEGFLITPQVETLKLSWEPLGEITQVDVQILSPERDNEVVHYWPKAPFVDSYVLVYEELLKIPPGRYALRMRIHARDRAGAWSDAVLLKKDWP